MISVSLQEKPPNCVFPLVTGGGQCPLGIHRNNANQWKFTSMATGNTNDFMNIFEPQKDSSNAETVRLGGDNRAGE